MSAPKAASRERVKSGQWRAGTGFRLARGLVGGQAVVGGAGFCAPASRTALDDVTVVEEAIEHGGDGCGVAQQLPPVFDGTIRSQQCTRPLIAAHDDLEQVFGGGEWKFAHTEVINDEERNGCNRLHELPTSVLHNGLGEIFE